MFRLVSLVSFLFVPVIVATAHAAEQSDSYPTTSPIVGFKLPNDPSTQANLSFAGIPVTSLESKGCPSELAMMLRWGTGPIKENTCAILLVRKGEELSMLASHRLIHGTTPLPCGFATVTLNQRDFLSVRQGLIPRNKIVKSHRKKERPISRIEPDFSCYRAGEICLSPKGISFQVGCEDGLSVSVSTKGTFTVTGQVGSLKIQFEE